MQYTPGVDLSPRSRSDGCIEQYQLGSIYMQSVLDLDLGHNSHYH